jgi:hypothetical protein
MDEVGCPCRQAVQQSVDRQTDRQTVNVDCAVHILLLQRVPRVYILVSVVVKLRVATAVTLQAVACSRLCL